MASGHLILSNKSKTQKKYLLSAAVAHEWMGRMYEGEWAALCPVERASVRAVRVPLTHFCVNTKNVTFFHDRRQNEIRKRRESRWIQRIVLQK